MAVSTQETILAKLNSALSPVDWTEDLSFTESSKISNPLSKAVRSYHGGLLDIIGYFPRPDLNPYQMIPLGPVWKHGSDRIRLLAADCLGMGIKEYVLGPNRDFAAEPIFFDRINLFQALKLHELGWDLDVIAAKYLDIVKDKGGVCKACVWGREIFDGEVSIMLRTHFFNEPVSLALECKERDFFDLPQRVFLDLKVTFDSDRVSYELDGERLRLLEPNRPEIKVTMKQIGIENMCFSWA